MKSKPTDANSPQHQQADGLDGKRFAVVDDDPAVRDSVRVLLEVLGGDVRTYEGASDFFRESPHVDCLIVDYHMPGLNGLELVLELHRRGLRPPVVLVTAASDQTLERAAADLGIKKVVKKSEGAQALLRAIREEHHK